MPSSRYFFEAGSKVSLTRWRSSCRLRRRQRHPDRDLPLANFQAQPCDSCHPLTRLATGAAVPFQLADHVLERQRKAAGPRPSGRPDAVARRSPPPTRIIRREQPVAHRSTSTRTVGPPCPRQLRNPMSSSYRRRRSRAEGFAVARFRGRLRNRPVAIRWPRTTIRSGQRG